jgi:hypothetical protein
MHTKRHLNFTAPHLLPPDYNPLIAPTLCTLTAPSPATSTTTSALTNSLLHYFAEPIRRARTLIYRELETCHTRTCGPNRNQHRAMGYKLMTPRGVVTGRRREASWNDTFKPRTEIWTRAKWCGTRVWSCRGGREATRCGYQTTRGYTLIVAELGGHKMVVLHAMFMRTRNSFTVDGQGGNC